MIRFIIPTLAQFRYLRNLRTKERREALLAQQRNHQANNYNLALEQEEHPVSPASGSSNETTTAVSKSKDCNREIATPSHPSTKPVSQVEMILAVERIGASEMSDLDHSPTAVMHASDNHGNVEIDGCDDESQATTWLEPTEKDKSMPLDVGAKRALQTTIESAGQRKKSRTQENTPTSGETAGQEEEEESPKDSPILLHQNEEDSNNNTTPSRNIKPCPDVASPVASKKSVPLLDPLSSPDDESGCSPLLGVKRSKRPLFGKGRKRKLQQTSLNFGTTTN